ncbi:AAA family ATPase [Rickettsiales endosymbiont of Stachyamoeba lipophora]|uniref:AAA family ATPase n=1 Tax=Rickettsiales endosymbiont of Stachyamoeba lipophora TaxID=2486578 RepID=UPI000F64BEF9|nr:AAA family ATPase [Rickettsiales endosymbiont of Stachyamoeba lipophora]AZL15271.1 RNA polymerase subunit sigma-70 [Rickettsiales endosymbiont of Stachyamoeba lipophora]
MQSNINIPLNVVNVEQLLKMELPPREFIVHPILPKQGLAMIYAKRGIGKTFVALQLSCCIASAVNMFDDKWKIERPYKVLYIDGEMPANTIKERLMSLVDNFQAMKNSDNLKIITPDLQKNGLMPNLATLEGQQLLEEYVLDTDVIIIDNLSTLCRNGKENDADSWIPVQEWLLRLRALGKSIIIIHHAGKNDQQRGTSKREDILDTVIALRRPEHYKSSEGARFEVHYEKSRGFSGEEANSFEARLSIDSNTNKASWIVHDIEDADLKRILELHKEGYTRRRISEELDKRKSASTVHRILKKAQEEGVVA